MAAANRRATHSRWRRPQREVPARHRGGPYSALDQLAASHLLNALARPLLPQQNAIVASASTDSFRGSCAASSLWSIAALLRLKWLSGKSHPHFVGPIVGRPTGKLDTKSSQIAWQVSLTDQASNRGPDLPTTTIE